MPKLREIDINYDQIRELVYQLEFDKKVALIKDVTRDKRYKNDFYRFTKSLVQKHNIPEMNESELDNFLHE
jgi:23S rRNA maturation-related 3'-5' exoribonuclease YhaM